MIASTEPQALRAALSKRLGLLLSKRAGLALAIWGEPGVGKSWTARQVLGQLPSRSASVQATDPLPTLLALLPRPTNLPAWVENSLERLLQGQLEPARVADTLAAYLTALAPFVLLVEDLHEANPEQQGLWLALAQEGTRSRGLGLLFTTRTPPPEPLEPYPLGSLGEEGATALLQNQAGGSLPPEATRWVYRRAGGNPLFTLEYFRHLTRLGYLWSDGSRWRWREPPAETMPTSVEALIVQLTHGTLFTPQAEAALAARALLPAGAGEELWAQGAGLSRAKLRQAREELEDKGILVEGEFVHPLFREVIGRELGSQERQAIARRAVEALRAEHPEQAALLVEEAGLSDREALELLQRAAQSSPNTRQSAEFLARAAGLASGPEQPRLALQAARRLRDFDPNRAAAITELALRAAPQDPEAIFLRAEVLTQLGRGAEAEPLLATLPASERQARWFQALLEARQSRGDYAGTLELWNQHPEFHASTASRIPVGQALIQLGRFAQAKDFLQAEGTPKERAQLLRLYATILLDEGNFAAATEALNRALELLAAPPPDPSETQRFRSYQAEIRFWRSLAFYRWGRYGQAVADLEAYLRFVGEQGDGRRYALGQANLGLYLLELGQYERAEETLLESLSVLERTGNPRGLAVVGQGLVRLYLEWAPPHGGALALKHAQAAERAARKSGSLPLLAETLAFTSWAEATQGQPKRVLLLLDEVKALAASLGEPRLEASGRWIRGLALERLGQATEALEQLSEAVGQMRELGFEPFAHRLALEMDRIKGDRKSAERRIPRFEAMGNLNWANIARRYFPQSETTPAPQAPPGLELCVLGTLQIKVEDVPVDYGARKGKELLALLLEARLTGHKEVNQLDLYDALYPDMDETKAASALKQLVYRLRIALGAASITRTAEGYALGSVRSDAEAFLQTGDTQLWRGPYLEGLGQGWDVAVSDSLYHALRSRAQELLESEPEEVLRLARLLLEADPYDREALALGVRSLQATGNISGLERFYRQGLERFAEVGERLPQAWSDFLAMG